MNLSGVNGAIIGGQIISPVKFEFGEPQLAALITQVKKVATQHGGALPVQNPVEILALGLVLEKLAQISEQLAVIEVRASVVK